MTQLLMRSFAVAEAADELPEPSEETPAFLLGEEELEALLEATADMDDEADGPE